MSEVGRRIESDGHLATVLFVGQIPRTKGEWLGVEWDDVSRGKHNGTHEGVQYFTTIHPTSGSFIRRRNVIFGVSLLTALQDRYGLVDDDTGGIQADELFVEGGKNRQQTTVVEFVGAQALNQQQSEFDRLLDISLRGNYVSEAGPPGVILKTIPAVEEMDLSRNLLPSWHVVSLITEQLPCLNILNLSENKLRYPKKVCDLSKAFSTVKTVYLNKNNLTWQQVLECTSMLQNLHQLHVCFNQITTITTTLYLNHLQLLNFEGNPIESWKEILNLGKLPQLGTLILNDTGLTEIEFPDVSHGQSTNYFPSLHTLAIVNNKIHQWTPINELNKLAKLTMLTFKKNPILAQYPDDAATSWGLVVAKLGQLLVANKSVITNMERTGAELDYLRLFGKAWRESGGHQDPSQNKPNQAFLNEHPRYHQMINKYGALDDKQFTVQSTALMNRLISVMIECPYLPEKKPLKKKLPLTMTVQKLKTLTQRLFKVDPRCMLSMKLAYVSHEMSDAFEIEMELDQKEIDHYSIEEGDRILVRW